MAMNGYGWLWMAMDGYEWLWMAMHGNDSKARPDEQPSKPRPA
jgi:hypothetical protein